ncbi:MAG: aldose sugar dehydrogenase [Alphaproteobacteria bacterium]|nr:MAG: aldose sugar dehydrogenase [Caulobacteraceae bacterium]TPW08873.1 MAG: aldose sugar dehydrogenase [Alphaproteobacteria bacterium]
MLVTEREGRLRIVSAEGVVSEPLAGVPEVDSGAYSGLLDVAVHPRFRDNHLVFLAFSEPRARGSAIAVARATLAANALTQVEVIFQQTPGYDYAVHNGSRLAFGPDGALYVTLGDRNRSSMAQDLDGYGGKIVRIGADGTAMSDNPFVGRVDARPEIWAIGLRNAQGLAFEPGANRLWAVDHGPNDGDELNIITRGANFGWPLVSSGGLEPDEQPTRALQAQAAAHPPATVAPVRTWTPAIAPSAVMFYTGRRFQDWRGDLFVGALAGKALIHLKVRGGRVVSEERLLEALDERIRDVQEGPDGLIYVLTDNAEGRILRLSPTSR